MSAQPSAMTLTNVYFYPVWRHHSPGKPKPGQSHHHDPQRRQVNGPQQSQECLKSSHGGQAPDQQQGPQAVTHART